MFRIDVATAAATLPSPGSAGTEGFFTEGNPGTGVPATVVTGDWLNMVQEELRAVVIAGGGTPGKSHLNQVVTAIQALIQQAATPATGGLLSLSGGTLTFAPCNGALLNIGGVNRDIPSVGTTVSSSGASNNTTYYIYTQWSGSPLAMHGMYSLTAPVADATTGLKVMTGDATKTFVGWAATNGSGAWRLARSLFNDTTTPTGPQGVIVFDGRSGGATAFATPGVSVTRSSTGKYTLTVNMADASYGIIATCQPDTGTSTAVVQEETGTSKTSTQVNITAYINTATPSLVDPAVVAVAIYGKRLGD